MLGKIQYFANPLFEQPLSEVLNQNKPLYQLTNKIDWDFIEKNLSQFYSKKARSAYSIRLMTDLNIYGDSDKKSSNNKEKVSKTLSNLA